MKVRGEISEHRKKRYNILESPNAEESDSQIVVDNYMFVIRAVFDFEFAFNATKVDLHMGAVFEVEYDIGYHRDWSERRDNDVGYYTVKRVVRFVVISLDLENVGSQKTNFKFELYQT